MRIIIGSKERGGDRERGRTTTVNSKTKRSNEKGREIKREREREREIKRERGREIKIKREREMT